MAFLYMVECEGNTIYTGIAADIERRLKEHRERGSKCAKYTRTHPIKRLLALWETDTYAVAAKGEYAVKKLSRRQKEGLIASPFLLSTVCPTLAGLDFRVVNKKSFPLF